MSENVCLIKEGLIPKGICDSCNINNQCTCITISDDITQIFNNSKFDDEYAAKCGPSSRCFLRIASGKIEEVSCPSVNNPNISYIGDMFWVFVIMITIFLLLVSFSSNLYFLYPLQKTTIQNHQVHDSKCNLIYRVFLS